MPSADTIALAQQMKRLTMWLDERCQPEGCVRRQYGETPFGACYVTVDRERQAKAASANHNRVYLCGRGAGLEPEGLDRLRGIFADAGVERIYIWLSPGPDMDTVRAWLAERGCRRVRWTNYPVLRRSMEGTAPFNTDLQIREVGAREVAAAKASMGETMWPEYVRSVGKDGLVHFMAFDGVRPVAIGMLGAFEGIGYLTTAATTEADRKRGAQQALIARRIERARQLGCTSLVVETLSMAQQSLRNLTRAGFEEVYDKEVYEWAA